MAKAKKEKGEKRPVAYSKKFEEKPVEAVEPEIVEEQVEEKPVELAPEEVKYVETDVKVTENAFTEMLEDIEQVKEKIKEEEAHPVSDKYDAEVVAQVLKAAQMSKRTHGIVNVIQLSRAYYIPVVDLRAILAEGGMV